MITGELTRTHGDKGDQPIEITVSDSSVEGVLIYRRYNTDDDWVGMKMKKEGNKLYASLPHQPPAGKLEYFIQLNDKDGHYVLPQERTVVTRFKGHVPGAILYAHVFFIFIAMFLSNWTGLEAIYNSDKMYRLAFWTTAFLFIGGMILGPIVQKYAFGALWTGVPFGFDLTDNKTLVAMIAWALAAWRSYKQKPVRPWIIIAALVLIVIYLIPHSMMGSELDYKTMEVQTGQ